MHHHRDRRRIGPAAERHDQLPRVALPQVIEQRQRHGPRKLFFLALRAGFPRGMARNMHLAGRGLHARRFAAGLGPVELGAHGFAIVVAWTKSDFS